MKLSIYWTCSVRARENICQHLHISGGMMVNGETDVELPEEHHTIAELFRLQRDGWLKIRQRNNLTPNDYYDRTK